MYEEQLTLFTDPQLIKNRKVYNVISSPYNNIDSHADRDHNDNFIKSWIAAILFFMVIHYH